MNSQITSKRRPALAALLMVLSASAVLAEDAKVNNVQFKGAFDGHDNGVVQGATLVANASGAGTASHIGRFTYTTKATVDLTTGLGTGVFQLVVANGDVINGSFVGRGGETDTPNVGHIIELVAITGGTGRFRGASGDCTLDRLVDETTVPNTLTSGSLTGTISTPASNN